jgi:hypothetical protein
MQAVTGSIYGLSTGTIVVLVLLGLLELGLMVWAVLDIIQRPAVLWGQKWIWLVIVILFGLIGPLVYLAVGRVQPPVPETTADQTSITDRARQTADLLYGPRPDAQPAEAPRADSSWAGTPSEGSPDAPSQGEPPRD